MAPQQTEEEIEQLWRWALTSTHHGRLSSLPSASRCTVCRTPFSGVSGLLAHLLRRHQSNINPHICNYCEDVLPAGGAEVDMAVLFADVRGSTSIAETLSSREYSRLLNRFYESASRVLIRHRAVIDKLIGDEVMAFFLPVNDPDPDGLGFRRQAVSAAVELMHSVGYRENEEPWLPLAIGVNAGDAFVGKLGTEGVHTFTTIGDTVNIAARMRSEAQAGEILIGDGLYETVSANYPGLEERELIIKGKTEPLLAYSLRTSE